MRHAAAADFDVTRHIFDEQTSQKLQSQIDSERSHAVAGDLFDGEANGRVNVTSNNRLFLRSTGSVGTRSAAIYGDLTVDFSDRLSVEAGLRYTSEKKTGTVFNQGYTDATFTTPNGFVAADFTDSKTFGALSPRLSVSWHPTEDVMLYAQASRGFKSGSYNIRADTVIPPGSGRPYEDETSTSYELGAKTQWLDGRLTLDAALFHNDYRDLQLSVSVNGRYRWQRHQGHILRRFPERQRRHHRWCRVRTGRADRRHFRWLANAGYLDAKYDEYISDGVNIADSQRLVDAPRWTGGLSAIVDVPLGGAGALVARVDGHYQSKVYSSTDASETLAQDGYTLWNASLAYGSPQKNWQLALSGQNLSNKAYRTSGNSSPLIGYYGPPRTFALSLSWFF